MKMNKIYTESSIGELIDRITILEIKKIKISKKSDLVHVNKECKMLKKNFEKECKNQLKNKKVMERLKNHKSKNVGNGRPKTFNSKIT